MSLAKLLTQKIEADGLSLAQAAEKADVSLPSFRSVAAGKAVPNARSIDKYASFLGVSVEDVRAAAGSRGGAGKGKGKAKGKRGPGRPPGKAKGKRGPGRPPGTGKRGPGRPPGTGKKLGRPPGSGKKRGRPPGRKATGGGAGAALVAIGQALASAEGLMGDELAVHVHNLGAKQRDLIQSILATF